MLSESQITEIKKQLLEQIDKSFPADKKDFAKQQIESMNSEQLEEFLKQNKLAVQEGGLSSQGQEGQQCIFCAIASGKMESSKIDEIPEAIAVLEINPASRGHVMIIPKAHVESKDKIPKDISLFAEKVSKKLKLKLKPKPEKILTENANLFGHETINLIPVYEGDSDSGKEKQERKPADKAELAKLQKELKEKPKPIPRKPKVEKIKPEEKLRLPKRIP
jgi:histidine triad (HIT) family protein